DRSRTGLMDARRLFGPESLLSTVEAKLRDSLVVGPFLLGKLRERDSELARTHASPLVVVPNLKYGAGGLRCFHAANWLAKTLGEQPKRPDADLESVLTARNLLHAISGKPQDELTRPRQAEIADALGIDMFEFLSGLAAARHRIHASYLHARERLKESRFEIVPGVFAIRGEVRITSDADLSAAASGVGIGMELGLHAESAQARPNDNVVAGDIIAFLASGESAISTLDQCGLLDHLLPELTACRYLMPRDASHEYTVFEHTIQAVRQLFQQNSNPGFLEIWDSLRDPGLLVLATLLHDVGKVDASRPHSIAGEQLAREVGRRWNLDQESIELVAWLVREHLAMAHTARMRDVQLSETIDEFVKLVETETRLKMLLLLTRADIAAVSSDALTGATESTLTQLYGSTLVALTHGAAQPTDPAIFRRRAKKAAAEIAADHLDGFLDSLPAYYLATMPPEVVADHFQLVEDAKAGQPSAIFEQSTAQGTTEITVTCADRPGLLSEILGVLYANDLSLSGVRAHTTETEQPIAIDILSVAFGGRPVPSATASVVKRDLMAVMLGEQSADSILVARGKEPNRPQGQFRYEFVGGSPTIIDFYAPRGRGMAFRLSRLVADLGWSIRSARVGQWAGQGVAAFYVTDKSGRGISKDDVLASLSARQCESG
ncbi:MAG: HD domain-containing protein, partial [Chthonomonas sp.]|nr:HD domain-containing protein [Chthonomonas sp.]